MKNIDTMSSSEWLAYRDERLEAHYERGLKLIPEPTCNCCDVHNDYVCLDHELMQIETT
jgi:hypothetical protein